MAYRGHVNPKIFDGLVLWIDSTDYSSFLFSSPNVISTWKDKSGNNNHYTQGTLNLQPILSSYSGYQSVEFDATKVMATPVIAAMNEYTIFIVCRYDSFIPTMHKFGHMITNGTIQQTLYKPSGSNVLRSVHNTTSTTHGQFLNVGINVECCYWDGSTVYTRLNGIQSGLTNIVSSQIQADNWVVGSYREDIPNFDGHMLTAILFNKNLPLQVIQQLESALMVKFGVS